MATIVVAVAGAVVDCLVPLFQKICRFTSKKAKIVIDISSDIISVLLFFCSFLRAFPLASILAADPKCNKTSVLATVVCPSLYRYCTYSSIDITVLYVFLQFVRGSYIYSHAYTSRGGIETNRKKI